MPPYTPPGQSAGMVPSVLPTGVSDPVVPQARPAPSTALDNLTSPQPPANTVQADRLGTLTAPPVPGATGLPPGAYASPWYGQASGCCGPLGKNGPVDYELLVMTGPNIPFGSGPFTDHLNVGWGLSGIGRTLFFNPEGDAAWALSLGVNYIYNRGKSDDFVDMFVRQSPLQQQNAAGQTIAVPRPDLFTTTRIRDIHRTAFTFAVGRDWWLWGSGLPGGEDGWNLRLGTDVGGRWGTAHADVVPIGQGAFNYARRQGVFHGVMLGFHSNFEMPVGGWIWVLGTRAEWSYDWMDIAPPLNGDIQNINLMFTTGIRF
jgi:hypothetical protein